MIIKRTSILDGKIYQMDLPVDPVKFQNWIKKVENNTDGLIQNEWPELSKDVREFLKSGITPEKWKEIFGEEEK
jgi:hypothetical protein